VELAVLIAQNAPDRHAVPIAGYHRLLAFISALICVGVMAGFLWRPTTWPGISQRELGPFFQLVIGWGFGSVAARSLTIQRMVLNAARTSSTKISGCSNAAKCPPFSFLVPVPQVRE
jgi:hypothetical protein